MTKVAESCEALASSARFEEEAFYPAQEEPGGGWARDPVGGRFSSLRYAPHARWMCPP